MPTTAIDLLKDMHGRSHGIMTGSGTSALVLSLWALGLHGKRVAIPNGVCYSVPLAVILSGNQPVYLDIDRETLSLGVAQLRKYRTWYDAVIAVHNYGARCDIEGIAAFCAKEGLPLIEDCCVALGVGDIGHWGDASVFSFGAGKIVDVGNGGAIVADDEAIIDEVWHTQRCFIQKHRFGTANRLSALHTWLYNQYYSRKRRRLSVFGTVAKQLGSWTLRCSDPWDYGTLVGVKLKGLRDSIDERWCKWENLRRRLHDYGEPFIHKSGVDWRFNIFIEEGRDDLLRHLHAKGYHASSWHAPADLFFKQRREAGRWPVTDWVANHILNLWVDHTVGNEYIEEVSGEVREWMG